MERVPFLVGCLLLYVHNVVVVIKVGDLPRYIHGCLFCVGAYYPDFYGTTGNMGCY